VVEWWSEEGIGLSCAKENGEMREKE